LRAQMSQYAGAAVAISAVEVARIARHEATGRVDTAQIALRNVWVKAGRPAALLESIEAVGDDLRDVNSALLKIKYATSPPREEWRSTSMHEIWQDAVNGVAEKLRAEKIDATYTGPRVDVYAQPDWLQHVFFNLLLNSIDAFGDAKRGGRRIELSASQPSARSATVEFVYRDNASGVIPQRLHIPSDAADLPVREQLFQPGVTSKKRGSGLGLWLVRHILSDHYGSIDLTDRRGGIMFLIRLPKPQAAIDLLESERLR
jgi:signal transduction histidine kinase